MGTQANEGSFMDKTLKNKLFDLINNFSDR